MSNNVTFEEVRIYQKVKWRAQEVVKLYVDSGLHGELNEYDSIANVIIDGKVITFDVYHNDYACCWSGRISIDYLWQTNSEILDPKQEKINRLKATKEVREYLELINNEKTK